MSECSPGELVDASIRLRDAGQLRAAAGMLEHFVASSASVDGLYTLALAVLSAGDLPAGWEYYRSRWLREPGASMRQRLSIPEWAGQDLRGRSILLNGEQGLGDAIQFIRYAKLLADLGAEVVAHMPLQLHGLLRSAPGVTRMLDPVNEPVSADFVIDMMTVPCVFGTNIDSIPRAPRYLDADDCRTATWRDALNRSARGRRKVGLSWAGNPAHQRDRERSMAGALLQPIVALTDVQFVLLQRDVADASLASHPWAEDAIRVGERFTDLGDAAAAIAALDLVITVDSMLAHLAGALGVPVWTLIPSACDWRWLRVREDTPWYPTMRLFRQREPGNWDEVIERVKGELQDALVTGRFLPWEVDPGVEEGAYGPAFPAQWVAGVTKRPGHRPGFSAVADTCVGMVQYLPDEAWVGDSVVWYGEYLESALQLLRQNLRSGDVVVEVDAGVGMHTLALSLLVGDEGRVIAYEVDTKKRAILETNVRVQRRANVEVDGRARADTAGSDAQLQEVRLDALGLVRLDWLKVNDPEGVVALLEGEQDTIWRLRPNLYLAVTAASVEAVKEAVGDLGYRSWVHDAPLYNLHNFNRRDEDIFAGAVVSYVLAAPEEASDFALPSSTGMFA